MTESEARRIFNEKLPLCNVLGLDVRVTCVALGVPGELVDKFVAEDKVLTAAMSHVMADPSLLVARAPVTEAGSARLANPDSGFVCLGQACTRLPMNVWAMTRGDSRKAPYIRVQTNHEANPQIQSSVDISIDRRPRVVLGSGIADPDLALVRAFVQHNLAVLRDYWNARVNSLGLSNAIWRDNGTSARSPR